MNNSTNKKYVKQLNDNNYFRNVRRRCRIVTRQWNLLIGGRMFSINEVKKK